MLSRVGGVQLAKLNRGMFNRSKYRVVYLPGYVRFEQPEQLNLVS